MTQPQNAPAYEDDFVAWLDDQAGRARRSEVVGLDLENIAEELEGIARGDRREIRTRLTVLLVHLLKYVTQPKRRSSSWLATIGEQRTHHDRDRRQPQPASVPRGGLGAMLCGSALAGRSGDSVA
jgi:Domain of unknown function DUF29